jgi:hypothetical protein
LQGADVPVAQGVEDADQQLPGGGRMIYQRATRDRDQVIAKALGGLACQAPTWQDPP